LQRFIFTFDYLQGGAKLPTGGIFTIVKEPASAFSLEKGQQIWCKSKADGYSPDERGEIN
jgi:hypothetical protein